MEVNPDNNKRKAIRERVEARIREQENNADPVDHEVAMGQKDKPDISLQWIINCLQANESGDGEIYIKIHEDLYVFNKTSGQWLVWNGHFWEVDIDECALAAVETVAEIYLMGLSQIEKRKIKAIKAKNYQTVEDMQKIEKELIKRIKKLRSRQGRINCLKFAETIKIKAQIKPLSIREETLNRDPWKLGCANGVVDLRTGELRDGRPTDWISKASPVEYPGIEAPADIWEKTLYQIFARSQADSQEAERESRELILYIQRLFGYALTALTEENILPILWGSGRNGKTTIVETLKRILGPLAATLPSEILLDQGRARNSAAPSPDLVILKSTRAAFVSETDENRRFSPSRVKWLSGSDSIVARGSYDRWMTTFRPTHTLFLLTNEIPHAPAHDFAFWARVHLIPFQIAFVDRPPQAENEFCADKKLSEKLKEEEPGILAWLVRGCLAWQIQGLNPPDVVKQATAVYRRDEDWLSDFVEERCFTEAGEKVSAADLFTAFQDWYEDNISKKPISKNKFGRLMGRRFEKKKSGGVNYYMGLRLLKERELF